MKDVHHIMYPRRVHEVYPQSLYIRNSLLVRGMPRDEHDALHANTSPTPLLGFYALQRVARELQSSYADPFEGIDDFCFAVENANQHPKCKPMERQLGELAIATIREQIPFIRYDRS